MPRLMRRSPNRTLARELALQALYRFDVCRKLDEPWRPGPEELVSFLVEASEEAQVRDYAQWLVEGVLAELADLDGRIESVTANWKLGRLASIDRCVLRLGLYELLFSDEVPPKVTINEAINLAKKFSTEQSGAFVNGVLDRLYGQAELDPTERPE